MNICLLRRLIVCFVVPVSLVVVSLSYFISVETTSPAIREKHYFGYYLFGALNHDCRF